MSDFIYINPKYSQLLERENLISLDYLLNWNKGVCVGEHGQRMTWRVELSYKPDKLESSAKEDDEDKDVKANKDVTADKDIGDDKSGDVSTKIVIYIRQEKKIPIREIIEDCFNVRTPASRAMKTLIATQILQRLNIDAAELICVIERRCLNLPRKAVAIQNHVYGDTLYHQLNRFGRPIHKGKFPNERKQLFYELGDFVRKLHDGKVDWPDFVAKHIIVNYVKNKKDNRTNGYHKTNKCHMPDESHMANESYRTNDYRRVDERHRINEYNGYNGNDERDKANERHWKFTLIDIDRLYVGANARKRLAQLDKFLLSFRAFLKPSDLLRMGYGYLGLNMSMPRSVRRELFRKFFPDGWRWIMRAKEQMRALSQMPDDVPLQEEELYERVNGNVVNMRLKGFLQKVNLLEREALFTFNEGNQLVKKGIGRRVRMRFEIVYNNQRKWFYLKRVTYPKLKDQLDRILCGTIRHSICWHERYMIKQLSLARIPVPTIVAYSEKMLFCFERASALITEGIIGQSLEKFVPKIFHRKADKAELLQRRMWIRKLAELIGRFHRSGFCHRDLYLSHIFIGFKGNDMPVFYLIDLARCFKPYLRKRRWIIKDLSALNYSAPERIISRTDRMRFFKVYRGISKLSADDKILIKRILGKTRRIERHNRKSPAITFERKI